jgi:nitroreductase
VQPEPNSINASVSRDADIDALDRIVRSRRTNLRIDRDRPVHPSTVEYLIDLATWAPNHHLTQPWRFAVITGAARATLGELTADYQASIGVHDAAKLDKTRTKFMRAPAVLLVGCESSEAAPLAVRLEDRDATAAGVQNLLLAATAAGLASYWGSGAVCEAPEVKTMCGWSDHTVVLAAIYLGHPIGDVPLPSREPARVAWIEA